MNDMDDDDDDDNDEGVTSFPRFRLLSLAFSDLLFGKAWMTLRGSY